VAERAGLPLIDVAPLVRGEPAPPALAHALDAACRDTGFFYAVNHGVDEALQRELEVLSRRFFDLPDERKLAIRMPLGGRAWRGYFPVGGELTLAQPDLKEGIYFGEELNAEDPRVQRGLPLHGPNLFPTDVPELKDVVLRYLAELTRVGHALASGLGSALGLGADYFRLRYTAQPLVLFRIFSYPPTERAAAEQWGVGEHCDYGLLTLLMQDDAGGLEVMTRDGWTEATPVPNAFVCNIGDMLERMTGGAYRSTLHRVRNRSGRPRLSFPFFFDPAFDAKVEPISVGGQASRPTWDGVDVHQLDGTYGDYLLDKVAKVFPNLARETGNR
jgi:isopenicillin N synthase-like dioxygenase